MCVCVCSVFRGLARGEMERVFHVMPVCKTYYSTYAFRLFSPEAPRSAFVARVLPTSHEIMLTPLANRSLLPRASASVSVCVYFFAIDAHGFSISRLRKKKNAVSRHMRIARGGRLSVCNAYINIDEGMLQTNLPKARSISQPTRPTTKKVERPSMRLPRKRAVMNTYSDVFARARLAYVN